MGFLRFRRSIKIPPGIRLNLGKRSTSVSIGGRGAHVTLRPGHTARSTIGIPGSGVSYTQGGQTAAKPPGAAPAPARAYIPTKGHAWRGYLWLALMVAFAGYLWSVF